MSDQSDNNTASWLKIVALGVGAAGALYGASQLLLGCEEEKPQSSNSSDGDYSRRRIASEPATTVVASEPATTVVASEPATTVVASEPATTVVASVQGMSSENVSKKRPQKECQICSETSDELVVFHPCLHTIACIDCAARMRKCVECKSDIKERISEENRKTIPYKSPKDNDELICPICCDNKKIINLNCGHTFCKACSDKVNSCPVCRTQITSRANFY